MTLLFSDSIKSAPVFPLFLLLSPVFLRFCSLARWGCKCR